MNAPLPGSAAIAMRGAGYYSDNTAGAKAVIDAAAPLVLEALQGMAPGPGAFGIADFGAADGGTSLDLMRRLVRAVGDAQPGRSVSLTYTDLPHNDFSVLFRRLHGRLGVPDPAPLAAEPGLFTFASGTGFHEQILPDGTLDLGFSATAMHWLSGLPGPIADAVHAVRATAEEQAPFRRHAAADWERILLARARELKPGGRLVLVNFCVDEAGRCLGGTGGVDMFSEFARHWHSLLTDGLLTPAEARAGTLQQFYRTVDEFTAPLEDPDGPVRRAGLRLVSASTRVTPCPYAARFRQERDAAAFAAAYLPTLRSWTESTFAGALDPARPAEDRQRIVDTFYDRYQAAVAAAPAGHGMDYVHCFLSLAKDA